MKFRDGDKVCFRPEVNASYGPPDRRGKIGTITRAWHDGMLERLDISFDDEKKQVEGLEAALFEPAP